MSLECEYGAAQSRAAARADQTRWPFIAGTAVQLAGCSGKTWVSNAAPGQPGARFVVRSQRPGKNTWDRVATATTALHPAALRSLVLAHASPARPEGTCSVMGRYVRALSRAAHRNGGGEGA